MDACPQVPGGQTTWPACFLPGRKGLYDNDCRVIVQVASLCGLLGPNNMPPVDGQRWL